MKKSIACIISVALLMSFVSCSVSDSDSKTDRDGEETETETTAQDYNPEITFSTTDRDGNAYDESIFAEHELTMINMFEPWCGPCVGEMGAIESLYAAYSKSGFFVIGMYSDTGYEEELDQILSDNGTEYPIVHFTDDFNDYVSGYVPTTIFVDCEGHVVATSDADEGVLYIGSRTYSQWEAIITELL